ncbi:MAG: hypothetical protein LBV27_06620, partial [Oscillospiraceae bacterium]|nr:hypothetical protein [Oscillospiraceae bacterium]
MQNRTDMTGVAIMDKARLLIKNNSKWVRMVISAVTGFIMANSFIFGGVAPFGVAAAAALKGWDSYCAALGALLGYVLASNMLVNMKYIAALLLVVIVKWTWTTKFGKKETTVFNVGITLGAMLIASVVVILTMNYTLYDVMLAVAELLLACGTVYFFSRTLHVIEHGITGASRADVSCAVVSAAVVLMGFSGLHVGSLSIGRVLAAILIMLCARYGGEAAGSIAGVTAGIAIGLSGRDFSYVVSAYSLGGLISGVFGGMGRLAVACSFIIVNALTALFVSETSDIFTAVFEIFAASVIFMLIPQSLAKQARLNFFDGDGTGATQFALRDKLGNISGVLKEISATTHKVSEKLGKLEGAGFTAVHNSVADKVCKRCGMRTTCWQFKYADTVAALGACTQTLRKSGGLSRDNMPGYFVKNCCKLDMFI